MKILILTPWYPDGKIANSGVFIKSQAKALSKRNEVKVIFSTIDYTKFSFCSYAATSSNDNEISEIKIVVKKSIRFFNQLNYLIVIILQSWRIARSFKPEIIHAHVGYPSAFWAWCLAKFVDVPFVLTEHTRPINNFRSFFHKRLTIFGMNRANALLAVSNVLAKELNEYVKRSVLVIPNIVETERFLVDPFPKSDQCQIGFLGTLNKPVKGLDLLLRAVAILKNDFLLHIGGAGQLLQAYKLLAVELGIENKCKFYGFILPSEVPAFMSRLHFFVCASRSETFCVALAEAMAAGRPVVSTRCGGPEEFVDDSNGILVNAEDVISLQQGIEQMILNYKNYNSASISKSVSERFGELSFFEKIQEVYSGVF